MLDAVGLSISDSWFGAINYLVCSITSVGSRFCC